jgi:alkanesulfonate monooxygenase SsuD/methylene tetrahydromethanopterin reductase-like flavin-dependent oxidoreductase (luciferase family)
VWALAAETMDKAQYHFTSRALSRIQRDKGLLGPLLAPDEAAKVELTLHEQAKFDQFRKDSFVGTGPEVAQRITELKERVGVDEMAVVTWTHDEEVRRQSYTLLAEAYGFAPAS